ncbi:hypothetical protein NDU88_008756, partial [Pleurodeles waltl]
GAPARSYLLGGTACGLDATISVFSQNAGDFGEGDSGSLCCRTSQSRTPPCCSKAAQRQLNPNRKSRRSPA